LFVGAGADQQPAIGRAVGIPGRCQYMPIAGAGDRLADEMKRQERGERGKSAVE
jgi:hypothetical protein